MHVLLLKLKGKETLETPVPSKVLIPPPVPKPLLNPLLPSPEGHESSHCSDVDTCSIAPDRIHQTLAERRVVGLSKVQQRKQQEEDRAHDRDWCQKGECETRQVSCDPIVKKNGRGGGAWKETHCT